MSNSTWDPMTGFVEPCASGNYQGWKDLFYCVEPGSWVGLGTGLSLSLSILGAAW